MNNIHSFESLFEEDLREITEKNSDKRILILGTTCSGKSRVIENNPDYVDMDEVLYPLLTEEEKGYVCSLPWTDAIGKRMNELTRERVRISPGRPLFGTVLLDCDMLLLMVPGHGLLKKRCALRGADFYDSVNMHHSIVRDTAISGAQKTEIKIIDDSLYYLSIVEESLSDRQCLTEIGGCYFSTRTCHVEGDASPIWHINEYHIDRRELEKYLSCAVKKMREGWYLHAFNRVDGCMYVGLKNRFFELPIQKGYEWEKMISYGESVGVNRSWTSEIPLSV